MSREALIAAPSRAEELWGGLSGDEKAKVALKLLPAARGPQADGDDPRVVALFGALVVVAGNGRATADRALTLRNFVAETSADPAVWAQIRTVIGVGRCYLELTVHDRRQFLAALRDAGYAVNSWMERIGRRFSKYHRFDNARARTCYRFDPQLHFCNDRADEPEYGPEYFSAHWDAQSVYARHSSLLSRVPAALSHARHPASPEQVRAYLRRKKLWPVAESE